MDIRTGRTFALKAVSKGYLAQLNMEHSVRNEKDILKMVSSPFIVRLLATYLGMEHVYFLLEACLGGELFTTYEKHRLYKSEPHARFYVGCCVEALAHLHDLHVVYRDLKPENLLLDARGYCKVTDMGLAKITKKDKTYTLVGTPDYMAPEVIKCTGHNRTVDWWMLGILLFELLVGGPPFEAPSTEEVYAKVQIGINEVQFPFGGPAVSLVKALCHATPESRIAAHETREHQWFSKFDWHALRTCDMAPPYVPEVRHAQDLGNFRKCEEEQPPCVPYKETPSKWEGFAEHGPFAQHWLPKSVSQYQVLR
jgi:serine/threonine protein kinase